MTTPLPAPSSLRAKIPAPKDFLKDISSTNTVGPSLRYGSLYDEVRLNRQEDDPRLSMGIWKTELKRADWSKIETLCTEALLTESKDLQIAAWLSEAWTALDGIEGYTRGIQLLSGLCEIFWKVIHPQAQDGDDMENRQMIFEWLDSILSSRLMLVNLTYSKYDQTAFGVGFYKSVQHSDASQKRVDKASTSNRKIDPSKIIGTGEDFQKSLDQTSDVFLIKLHQNLGEASKTTIAFKTILASLLNDAYPSFSQILGTLKEMERIVNTALQTREPLAPIIEPPLSESIAEPSSETTLPEPLDNSAPNWSSPSLVKPARENLDLKIRDDAYRQIDFIATFLEQNDPHSLAPQILRQLVRWENKNMVDIFGEIAKTSEEYKILMKILGIHLPEK
ncbi:MAG: type VI secretion system protein TssA [Candidatus Paracaedibacter sp.]